MVIKIGDIFASNMQTIVNTVNCVGVMGKGIALEFKKRYPDMYKEYAAMCRNGEVKPGKPYYYFDIFGNSIINFPTKDHWRSPSKLSYVVNGLKWFRKNYEELGITSIAFPPLGCGNGGLAWSTVGPIMYYYLHDLSIDIEVYAPYGTRQEQLTVDFLQNNVILSPEEVIGSKNVCFNRYWYFILYVIQKLNNDKYALRVGRTIRQKICFVLTRSGIPTGFTFVRNAYGPYAKEVNDAITVLSNANLLTEVQLGQMIETRVSPEFKLKVSDFSGAELKIVEQVIDLLSRVKSTAQAEMMSTVMFSFDELAKKGGCPTEKEIYNYILDWKPRWKNSKVESEIISTIKDLSELGWIEPDCSTGFYELEEELF